MTTGMEKEDIEVAIKEYLLGNLPIILPDDGIINIATFPDEPRDLKVLGVGTDSKGNLLFRFSCSGTIPLSITYDFSVDSSK
jgi:hypothetical protein